MAKVLAAFNSAVQKHAWNAAAAGWSNASCELNMVPQDLIPVPLGANKDAAMLQFRVLAMATDETGMAKRFDFRTFTEQPAGVLEI